MMSKKTTLFILSISIGATVFGARTDDELSRYTEQRETLLKEETAQSARRIKIRRNRSVGKSITAQLDALSPNQAFVNQLNDFFGDEEVYKVFIACPKCLAFFANEFLKTPQVIDGSRTESQYHQLFRIAEEKIQVAHAEPKKTDEQSVEEFERVYTEACRKQGYAALCRSMFGAYNEQVMMLFNQQYRAHVERLLKKYNARCIPSPGSNLVIVFNGFPEYVVKIPMVDWGDSWYQQLSRFFGARIINNFVNDQELQHIKPIQHYLYRIPHTAHPGVLEQAQVSSAFHPIKRRLKKVRDAIRYQWLCDTNYLVIADNVEEEIANGAQEISKECREEVKQVIDHACLWDITPGNLFFTSEGKALLVDLEQPGMRRSWFHEDEDMTFLTTHWPTENYVTPDGNKWRASCGQDELNKYF